MSQVETTENSDSISQIEMSLSAPPQRLNNINSVLNERLDNVIDEELKDTQRLWYAFVAFVILLVIIIIVALVWTFKESLTGVPSYGTWNDYDNYAKDNGKNRDYWGRVAPGGGWTMNELDPRNNQNPAYMPEIERKRAAVKAKQDDLDYLYQSQLFEI